MASLIPVLFALPILNTDWSLNAGNWIAISVAVLGVVATWGRVTAKLDSLERTQDKLVTGDRLEAALAKMHNDIRDMIEKKIEKLTDGDRS